MTRHAVAETLRSQVGGSGVAAADVKPEGCSRCGSGWGVDSRTGESRGYRRFGSFVWRCTDCDRLQANAESFQRTTPY